MARTRAELRRDSRNALLVAVVAVAVATGGFLLAPGIAIIAFAVRPFAMDMGRAQLWLFSAVASALVYVGIRFSVGSSRAALRWFVGTCALAVAAFALAKFGFGARWPDLVFDAFVRGRS